MQQHKRTTMPCSTLVRAEHERGGRKVRVYICEACKAMRCAPPGVLTSANPRASWSSCSARRPYRTTLGVPVASSGASRPCPVCASPVPKPI